MASHTRRLTKGTRSKGRKGTRSTRRKGCKCKGACKCKKSRALRKSKRRGGQRDNIPIIIGSPRTQEFQGGKSAWRNVGRQLTTRDRDLPGASGTWLGNMRGGQEGPMITPISVDSDSNSHNSS